MNCIGLKKFSYDEDFSDSLIQEGKQLLDSARRKKER